MTVREFIELGRKMGQDALGIANDPESTQVLFAMRRLFHRKKLRCARPNCRKRVKYIHPKYLCSKHWWMWWTYGVKGKPELWWMRKNEN